MGGGDIRAIYCLGVRGTGVQIESLIKATSPIPKKLRICKTFLINSGEL